MATPRDLLKDPTLTATPPGFSPPSHQQPKDDPPTPGATTTVRTNLPPTGETGEDLTSGDGSGFADDGPPPSSTTSPSPGSPLASTAEAHQAITLMVREGVGLLTAAVDARLSPDTHAWAATEWELDAIAVPLGRIAIRHNPLGAMGAFDDASDAIEAGVGLVGYGLGSRRRQNDPILVVRQLAHRAIRDAIVAEAEGAVANAAAAVSSEAVHKVASAAVDEAVAGAAWAAAGAPPPEQ